LIWLKMVELFQDGSACGEFSISFFRGGVQLGAPCAAASEFDLSGSAFGPKNSWLMGQFHEKFIHEKTSAVSEAACETTNRQKADASETAGRGRGQRAPQRRWARPAILRAKFAHAFYPAFLKRS
jgi:hypothetical protein